MTKQIKKESKKDTILFVIKCMIGILISFIGLSYLSNSLIGQKGLEDLIIGTVFLAIGIYGLKHLFKTKLGSSIYSSMKKKEDIYLQKILPWIKRICILLIFLLIVPIALWETQVKPTELVNEIDANYDLTREINNANLTEYQYELYEVQLKWDALTSLIWFKLTTLFMCSTIWISYLYLKEKLKKVN